MPAWTRAESLSDARGCETGSAGSATDACSGATGPSATVSSQRTPRLSGQCWRRRRTRVQSLFSDPLRPAPSASFAWQAIDRDSQPAPSPIARSAVPARARSQVPPASRRRYPPARTVRSGHVTRRAHLSCYGDDSDRVRRDAGCERRPRLAQHLTIRPGGHIQISGARQPPSITLMARHGAMPRTRPIARLVAHRVPGRRTPGKRTSRNA